MSETAQVIDLEFGKSDEAPQLGIDASFVSNLPGDRQVQLRTTFLQSMTQRQIDGVFDRLFLSIDRQKAKYELVDLKKELRKHVVTLQNMLDDEKRLDQQHEVEIAEIDAQIAAIGDDSGKAFAEAERQFHASGRRGKFDAQKYPQTANQQRAFKSQIDKLVETKDKKDAERSSAKQNIATSKERFEMEIRHIHNEIAEREALLRD